MRISLALTSLNSRKSSLAGGFSSFPSTPAPSCQEYIVYKHTKEAECVILNTSVPRAPYDYEIWLDHDTPKNPTAMTRCRAISSTTGSSD